MRKLLSFLILGLTSATTVLGQNYQVTTELQKKNVLMEIYTAINCQNCADGDRIAASILNVKKNKVFAIDIHGGRDATPSAGKPDFRTSEGQQLFAYRGRPGTPLATINRKTWNFENVDYFMMSRNMWASVVSDFGTEDAPVNLWVNAVYDGNTHKIKVRVEGYYTGTTNAEDTRIAVALTQNNIKGFQLASGLSNDYDYVHQHVLRGYITDLWGEKLNNPQQGTYFVKEYEYLVPDVYSLNSDYGTKALPEEMHVIAYVCDGQNEIYNVQETPLHLTNYLVEPTAFATDYMGETTGSYGYQFFDVNLKSHTVTTIVSATFDVTVNDKKEQVKVEPLHIDSFENGTVRIPFTYQAVQSGNNTYRIKLVKLNDKDVTNDEISGTFATPKEIPADFTVTITNDRAYKENHFYLKDAEGNTIKEFGPYTRFGTNKETLSLDPNKIYCIEITDNGGNGMVLGAKGGITLGTTEQPTIISYEMANGSLARVFFQTGQSTGIDTVNTTNNNATYYNLQGVQVIPGKQAGIYIKKQGGKTRKVVIK